MILFHVYCYFSLSQFPRILRDSTVTVLFANVVVVADRSYKYSSGADILLCDSGMLADVFF